MQPEGLWVIGSLRNVHQGKGNCVFERNCSAGSPLLRLVSINSINLMNLCSPGFQNFANQINLLTPSPVLQVRHRRDRLQVDGGRDHRPVHPHLR